MQRPATPPKKIRVLCVDDNEEISTMLGRCIEAEPDMECAGTLRAADDLVTQVRKLRPDVVIMDLSMPGKDPLEAVRELTATPAPRAPHSGRRAEGRNGASEGSAGNGARVIAYSGRSDHHAIDSAMYAGARGFLSKAAEIPDVLRAIREVARGKTAFEESF